MQAIVIFGRTSALLLAITVLLLEENQRSINTWGKVTSTLLTYEIQAPFTLVSEAKAPELVEFVAGAGFEPTTQRL